MQMKKKIIFIITKGIWGGTTSYVFDLVSNLPKEEYDSLVIFGNGDELKNKLEGQNIPYVQIKEMDRDFSIKKEIETAKKLYKILKEEKPDIVHLNSSKAGGLGSIVARLLGIKKIIFTLHGLASNEKRPLYQKYIILFFHWLTILLSTKTISVSMKTKIDLRELPFIKDKIEVVRNGIKPFSYLEKNQASKELQQITNIKENDFIVGTISELHKNKNVDTMIDVVSELKDKIPNIKYVVIGEGEERSRLQLKIDTIGLNENVLLIGKVENAKRLLKAFDIFVLTSKTEALPYVLLEAGFVGLPILASRVGGIPEIIDNDKSGILVRPRKEDIKNGLIYLLKNPNLMIQFSNEINKKIKEDFTFEKMMEKTLQIYLS
jgi:glycosyltransferase involved in cell wall biosynthesis